MNEQDQLMKSSFQTRQDHWGQAGPLGQISQLFLHYGNWTAGHFNYLLHRRTRLEHVY